MGKKILLDINLIRLLSIFSLVVMHALTIYSGGWAMPNGVSQVDLYYHISKLLYGICMPSITMISGYIFAYQIISLKRRYTVCDMIKIKFRRLIIPSLIFSTLYSLCFVQSDKIFTVDTLLDVISGSGHMWFLPMLFVCFIMQTYVVNIILPRFTSVAIAHLITFLISFVFVFIPLPGVWLFSLPSFFQFYIFFNIGYIIYYYKDSFSRVLTFKNVISLFLLYVVMYFSNEYLESTVIATLKSNTSSVILGGIMSRAIVKLLYIIGAILLYVSVNYYVKLVNEKINKNIITLCSLCYGVYIYHQFILKYLYYHTELPQILNSYLLPWIAIIITITSSLLMVKLTMKYRFGRFLLG